MHQVMCSAWVLCFETTAIQSAFYRRASDHLHMTAALQSSRAYSPTASCHVLCFSFASFFSCTFGMPGPITTVALALTPDHGVVIVVAALMAAQTVASGFVISFVRSRIFSKKFFATEFPELKEAPAGGYPDMGCGPYAARLPPAAWAAFNNCMRAHQNCVEGCAPIVTLQLLAGLFFPMLASVAGIVYLVARTWYTVNYMRGGFESTRGGSLLRHVVQLVLFMLSLWGGIRLVVQTAT